jgi:FKBP-type peptidyl-prolyl cis-trans isomerase 2
MTLHSAPAPSGTVQDGELIRLEFELWAESGGQTELVGTTREEVAQKALGEIPAGRKFGPRAHLVGGEFFPSGIEQGLVGATIGEEFTKEFTAPEAFGERDPKLIELFSMHEIERLPEMRREDAHLDIGTVLTIRGRQGRVTTLTQARVRVDFNPPHAGRKVRGTFKVLSRIAEPAEKVHAILEIEYGHPEEFHVEIREHVVTIKVPDRTKFDPAWFTEKPRVVDRIRTILHPPSVRFIEEYVTPTAEKAESPAAEAQPPSGKAAEAAPSTPESPPPKGA